MNAHEFKIAVDLMSQAAHRIDKEGGTSSKIGYGIRAIRTLAVYGAAFGSDADASPSDFLTDMFHAFGPSQMKSFIELARKHYEEEIE